MEDQIVAIPETLRGIVDRLRCPGCAADLQLHPGGLLCTECRHQYPVRDGIALLSRDGTTETWIEGIREETSQAYQEQYDELENAERYNRAYQERLFKRWSTKGEYRLLERLLGSQEHSETLLDVPCGGGRLSPRMELHTDLLIEADAGIGQLLYQRKNAAAAAPRLWMQASAFHLPFKTESVDGAVCVRLCHHLPTAEERQRLVEELLRVSRRFVIMTYFDFASFKNLLRRARRPFDHQPPKMTMTEDQVRELAALNGARLEACPWLTRFSSGHRYALMVKC